MAFVGQLASTVLSASQACAARSSPSRKGAVALTFLPADLQSCIHLSCWLPLWGDVPLPQTLVPPPPRGLEPSSCFLRNHSPAGTPLLCLQSLLVPGVFSAAFLQVEVGRETDSFLPQALGQASPESRPSILCVYPPLSGVHTALP